MTRWADDTVLDDPAALDEADPGGMLRATADSGAQIRRAVASTAPVRPRRRASGTVDTNEIVTSVPRSVASNPHPNPALAYPRTPRTPVPPPADPGVAVAKASRDDTRIPR